MTVATFQQYITYLMEVIIAADNLTTNITRHRFACVACNFVALKHQSYIYGGG